METAWIVKVAVSAAPYSIDKAYDYLIPPELTETALAASGLRCLSAGATAPVRHYSGPDAR